MNTRTVLSFLTGFVLLCGSAVQAAGPRSVLFATDRPERGWVEFRAAGYSESVCGVIYRSKDQVTNGMPLGAVDTGCLDLETNGTFGYSTIFNSIVPRGGATLRTPVLAMSIGGKTWASGGPLSKPSLPAGLLLVAVGTGGPARLGEHRKRDPGARLGQERRGEQVRYPRRQGLLSHAGNRPLDQPDQRRYPDQRRSLGRAEHSGAGPGVATAKNGVPLTGGRIAWSAAITAASPQPYAKGSGGDAALKLAVRQEDRIELCLEVAAVCGDHVGVDLKITAIGTGKSWDLAADFSNAQNPNGAWTYDDDPRRPLYLFEPGRSPRLHLPKEIHYWGHYPVADLEYETDAPVQMGLRAWTSFIPGDLQDSTIPGAVFEVHLRNCSAEPQRGTIVMDFPGPTAEEAGANRFDRNEIKGDFSGVEVKAPAASYALGIVGREKLRIGKDLGPNREAWTSFAQSLPVPQPTQAGSSAAVDFSLPAGQEKVVRFLLTWCAADWKAGGSPAAKGSNTFTHMYAKHYPSPAVTARLLAARHESLLKHILAWQQVIYAEKQLPPWLRDSLINNLYMITETGLWAQAKAPLGKWVRPEDGLFGMIESPRDCPQVECIPCSLYGNIPVVYFFPELALSTLRGYKNYQYPDGQVVWMFGGPTEFAKPVRPYQVASSDICMVELVDKMWLRTGDDRLVKEFYDGCKRATIHAMNLRPDYGEKQVISMPTGDKDSEWVEFVPLHGLVSHVGGLHLAQLRMAKRMAEKLGDAEFAKQCDKWFEAGSKAMEEYLWAGTHYLLYHEFKSGKKSDVLMGCQLDGDWIARFHGLPGVFRPDRVKTTLATIAKANADPKLCPYGMRVFANADGSKATGDFSYWGKAGTFSSEGFMLGMTYIYNGQRAFGEDVIRRTMDYVVVRNGYTWDFPLVWEVDSGHRVYGSDYYQNMMLWSVPAVIAGQDLSGPCKPGGLVERILKAAAK